MPNPLAQPKSAGEWEAGQPDPLFRSFFMGGFEGSCHCLPDGKQLDLIAATRHDEYAARDYGLVAGCGLKTVRDALRWHLIETAPGRYDWTSLLPLLTAARQAGIQVIWDLCHYGVPRGLDIWSPAFPERFSAFCAAAARIMQTESGGKPSFFCPVNEISFWAWAGGDHGQMYPAALGRGPELKRKLAHAAIVAIDAIRAVSPDARFVQAEPLIHVAGSPDLPETELGAREHRMAQFEAFDMIAGRTAPELGGSESHLDIIGLNYYPENQILRTGGSIPLGHRLYRPLRSLLAEVHTRYGRQVFISETGAEGRNGAGWLAYVAAEVRAARRSGVRVEGICLYPVLDYPGWKDERHCDCGLLQSSGDWRERHVDHDLNLQLAEERSHLPAALAG